jgi:hypothetical protein
VLARQVLYHLSYTSSLLDIVYIACLGFRFLYFFGNICRVCLFYSFISHLSYSFRLIFF